MLDLLIAFGGLAVVAVLFVIVLFLWNWCCSRSREHVDRSADEALILPTWKRRHEEVPTDVQLDIEFEELRRTAADETVNGDSIEWNRRFLQGHVYIYTDGSCNKEQTASGCGIYLGYKHPLNRSFANKGALHDCDLAEVTAARTALVNLKNWEHYGGENVVIRTDSKQVLDQMKRRLSTGTFADEYNALRELCRTFAEGVRFEHVYAHEGDPGNEQADRLAARAIGNCGYYQFKRDPSYDRATRLENIEASRTNDPAHIRKHTCLVRAPKKLPRDWPKRQRSLSVEEPIAICV